MASWADRKVQHLVHDRVKDFSAQMTPPNGKLSVDQADLRVIWVFHVETREIECRICMKKTFMGST